MSNTVMGIVAICLAASAAGLVYLACHAAQDGTARCPWCGGRQIRFSHARSKPGQKWWFCAQCGEAWRDIERKGTEEWSGQ